MEDPSGWSLTESDPQVFSELLRNLGVKGLQVVSARAEHEAEVEQLSRLPLTAVAHVCTQSGFAGGD